MKLISSLLLGLLPALVGFAAASPAVDPVARQTEIRNLIASLPSNHSPRYAPVIDPTIRTGMQALVGAARTWLHESAAA